MLKTKLRNFYFCYTMAMRYGSDFGENVKYWVFYLVRKTLTLIIDLLDNKKHGSTYVVDKLPRKASLFCLEVRLAPNGKYP